MRIPLIALLAGFLASVLNAGPKENGRVRMPARAGQFYPIDPLELKSTISRFLENAQVKAIPGEITGIWVPHAGYPFSGQIAANAYRLLQGKQADVAVIIGPSHYAHLRGASPDRGAVRGHPGERRARDGGQGSRHGGAQGDRRGAEQGQALRPPCNRNKDKARRSETVSPPTPSPCWMGRRGSAIRSRTS